MRTRLHVCIHACRLEHVHTCNCYNLLLADHGHKKYSAPLEANESLVEPFRGQTAVHFQKIRPKMGAVLAVPLVNLGVV